MFRVWCLGYCSQYPLTFFGVSFNDDSSTAVDPSQFDREEKKGGFGPIGVRVECEKRDLRHL